MSLIYQNESYAIRGAAMKVYNTVGCGFLEAVYQEALEIELDKRHIPYEREKELEICYDGIKLGKKYVADFVCYGKIILELKAVKELDDSHRSQLYNYLKATGFKLGFLINFGKYDELQIERRVL
jgi:GxxExxY protein